MLFWRLIKSYSKGSCLQAKAWKLNLPGKRLHKLFINREVVREIVIRIGALIAFLFQLNRVYRIVWLKVVVGMFYLP